MMSAKDVDMLSKLLMLTTSPHDGEALVALRKATGLLLRHDINWGEFVRGKVIVAEPSQARAKAKPRAPDVEDEADGADLGMMFQHLLATTHGSFRDFVSDVHAQWESRGRLSPRQREAIVNAFRRSWR
jgi:hypothetical protein